MTCPTPRLRHIHDVVLAGGVGAYPTEGVWGLGCDPLNTEALARLIRLKGRGSEKGLIVIAADLDQLEDLVQWPERDAVRNAMLRSWPGPVTWVMQAAPELPALLTGGRATIAVRVSAHRPVIELCRAVGMALVSTSANRSGHPACRRGWRVRRVFGNNLDWFLPGPLGGQRGPSEIREAGTGRILRAAAG
ncbi:L-threonylcarbamoyladenylate synthase [Spiribacter insolitus]|uniref:Threonylcarbamoyl-AMP synthase n=1 Tax=Spiribacter insolitus TaxID=3122417 RepID=A0ABV3TB16_9GAMM